MRPDFKHLLTERERYNSRWNKESQGEKKLLEREESNLDYEDWAPGKKVGIKTNQFGTRRTTKSLSENLSPLSNFLRSAVGRKWDDVFSEINEACPNDSAVSAHIYQHLWHFVVRKPLIEGDKIYDQENLGNWKGGLVESTQVSPRFYVHPETNLLIQVPVRSTKRSRRLEREAEGLTHINLKNKNTAIKIRGIWYECELVAIPKPTLKSDNDLISKGYKVTGIKRTWYVYPSLVDHMFEAIEGSKTFAAYRPDTSIEFNYNHFVRKCKITYGRKVYCQNLSQMSSKELKEAGLVNDT